jgi:hypothetical protein
MNDSLFVPPGHFYSPIASREEAEQAIQRANASGPDFPSAIKINPEAMIALWRRIAPLTLNLPFSDEAGGKFRYHFVNDMYSYGDAAVYFGLVHHFEPRRIVEIGSGYSSALALDMRDILNRDISLTFIEPYPGRLNEMVRDNDRATIEVIVDKVQNVPMDHFEALQANDILFVDSSHVAKAGSDVCFEIFEILPRLRPGVVVHFHDCFWPFEYPKKWAVDENRSWNELYFLRSFLMYNDVFEIVFFNSYFASCHAGEVAAYPNTPFLRNPGGGLWLQKRK